MKKEIKWSMLEGIKWYMENKKYNGVKGIGNVCTWEGVQKVAHGRIK